MTLEGFFLAVLSNSMVAGGLALVVLGIGRWLRRPEVLHWLWLAVLIKLFVPPLWQFGLLPPVEAAPLVASVLRSTAELGSLSVSIDPPTPGFGLRILLGVWGVGSLLFLGLSWVRFRHFRTSLARLEPADSDMLIAVESIARKLGLRRMPVVLQTEADVSPLLWSRFGAARLVLPRRLWSGLDETQREMILAHELAHLARGDDRFRWFELFAMVVYWWNPIVWLARRRLVDMEEASCDAIVMNHFPQLVEVYANGLVQTLRGLAPTSSSQLIPISELARASSLERRIRMLFSKVNPTALTRPRKGGLAVLVLVALVASPMLIARELPESPESAENFEFTGAPITFSLRDAHIREVLETFSRIGGFELEMSEGVQGKTTIELDRVEWDEALYQVLQMNGLTYQVVGDTIRVEPGSLEPLTRRTRLAGTLDGSLVYQAGYGGVTRPRLQDSVALEYPEEARAGGINGVVILDCLVDSTGRVRDAKVVRSNANVLTEAALAAANELTFVPGSLDGVPVASRVEVPLEFAP